MNLRKALIIAAVLTFLYLFLLTSLVPHNRITLVPGLTISEYSFISSETIAWSDDNFSEGWIVDLTTRLNPEDSGFVSNGSAGYLFHDFKGGGIVENLEVEKNVSVDTSISSYLTVRFSATTDDPSVCFSSAVITKDGRWVGLPWNHVSTVEQVLVFDISNYFSGEIVAVRFRITNDFNRSYVGGPQGVFMSFVSISSSPPVLGTSSFNAMYTQVLPLGQSLEVRGQSPSVNQSSYNISIVSAVYSESMDVNLSSFHYLNVTVMTDSPETIARVILWSEDEVSYHVLVTNYDARRWHQVIIDLKPFGITGNSVNKIELGYMVNVGPELQSHWVRYGEISFEKVD